MKKILLLAVIMMATAAYGATPDNKKKKKKKHTTTQPQVVYRTERNGTVAPAVIVTDTRGTTTKRTKPVGAIGEVIHSDDGDYWATNKCATLDPDEYGGRISALIFIDQHGKEFICPPFLFTVLLSMHPLLPAKRPVASFDLGST